LEAESVSPVAVESGKEANAINTLIYWAETDALAQFRRSEKGEGKKAITQILDLLQQTEGLAAIESITKVN